MRRTIAGLQTRMGQDAERGWRMAAPIPKAEGREVRNRDRDGDGERGAELNPEKRGIVNGGLTQGFGSGTKNMVGYCIRRGGAKRRSNG